MAGWHHQFNEHELGQTLGVGEGQGGLAYCSLWSLRVRLNSAIGQEQQHMYFGCAMQFMGS